MSAKARNKKYYPKYGEHFLEGPCLKCGIVIKRFVHPDSIRNYKMYCKACQSELTLPPDDYNGNIEFLAKKLFREQPQAEPVTLYRPGDPGFEDIANLYSPPVSVPERPFYDPRLK